VAEAGQQIEGFGGMRLRFVRVEPDELVMEAAYSGETAMPAQPPPPEPVRRLRGDRGRNAVIEAMKTGSTGRARPSRSRPALPTRWGPESRRRCAGRGRPALCTAEFFERLYGSGPDSARELGQAFFAEFENEFRLA
jgi:hypothetical protein